MRDYFRGPGFAKKSTILVIERPLLVQDEIDRIRLIKRLSCRHEGAGAGILKICDFFRFGFGHVIHGTDFIRRHVTSRHTICKINNERQLNHPLRFGSERPR